jgi:hypothetical protein
MSLKICDVVKVSGGEAPNRVIYKYGGDNSSEVEYVFNSAGYRSHDYDPKAQFKLCVIGESFAAGVGVPFEQTFGYRLGLHIASALKIEANDICFVNLAIAGASADYCVRTAMRQLVECKMDLVVCHLPTFARMEYLDEGGFARLTIPNSAQHDLENVPAHIIGWFELYNEHLGKLNLIKNALLLQEFFQRIETPYLFSSDGLNSNWKKIKHLLPFFEQLELSRILWHQYSTIKIDLAADNGHPGPLSHAALAISLLEKLGKIGGTQEEKERGRLFYNHAVKLKKTDQQWLEASKLFNARKLKRAYSNVKSLVR